MQAQPVAFEQADHGQRQQQNQLQGAGLQEAFTHFADDFFQREVGGKAGDDGCRADHQQWIEAQHKANDDDEHANQGP